MVKCFAEKAIDYIELRRDTWYVAYLDYLDYHFKCEVHFILFIIEKISELFIFKYK